MQKWNVILAVDINHGMGMNGTIPWKNKLDMDYFRYVTSYIQTSQPNDIGKPKKNLLVFGSRTKHGIKDDPKRDVITLSKTGNNFSKVLTLADNYNKIFICGGDITYKNFYNFADENGLSYRIYKNFINKRYDVDTIHKSRPYLEEFDMTDLLYISDSPSDGNEKEGGIYFTITDCDAEKKIYKQMTNKSQILHDPYISLLSKILDLARSENSRQTRNAETYSEFGETIRFQINENDISKLLPAKTLFYRGVIEELLFFLRGQTDTKLLEEKNINIWKLNTESTNGEMGPMYGYQLRNFGGDGCDQLKRVIHSLKTDPYSRRHIMTMFNPQQAEMGVLYPCHGIVIQFYVSGSVTEGKKQRLSLMMYQRSADVFLGLPFNIFSYGVLLLLMCREVNMEPGELIISLGDYHLYKTHVEKANLQMALHSVYNLESSESKNEKPKLIISDRVSLSEGIYEYSDFKLENYSPMGIISAEMYA